jgi:TonB family protein
MTTKTLKQIVPLRAGWILISWLLLCSMGGVVTCAAELKSAATEAALPPSSSSVSCLSCPAPPYPLPAAQRGLRGVVDLELTVGEDGRVREIKVLTSPCEDLKEAAVNAARGWTFTPAVRDGKPVREVVQIPVVFRLFQSYARTRQISPSTSPRRGSPTKSP